MIKQRSATVVTVLLITSCSNAAGITTTTVAGAPSASAVPTAAISPGTTIPPTTIPTPPPTTSMPSTTTGSATVGSLAALEALIDDVVAEVGEANLGGRENIPFLDINNPDPVAAMKSIIAFDLWVFTTWPDPPMVEIYTAAGSPGRAAYSQGANTIFKGGSRIVYVDAPYEASKYRIVDLVQTLPADLASSVPVGSVAVAYESSSGPYEVRRIEADSVDASGSGWTSHTIVTVMVPTSYGWQIWYEGS